MKKKLVIFIGIGMSLLIGGYFAYSKGVSKAAVDICVGVSTTFTGNAPSSVAPGESFTISNITSRPTTSYGMTVTSSTLTLSATNATPTSYNQNNTSTDPSPTTGAPTYTSYYPNWTLTAGSTTGQIVVKLVGASATVSGIGPISCNLTATLATIDIVAPSSSGGSGSPSSPSSGSSTSGNTNTSNKTTPSNTTTTSPTQTTDNTTTSEEITTDNLTSDKKTANIVINVVNKNNRAVKGAKVTLDNTETLYTETNGAVAFQNVATGKHNVNVEYDGKKIIREVSVKGLDTTNAVTVQVASHSNKNYVLYGVIGLIAGATITVGLIFGRKFWRHHRQPKSIAPPAISATQIDATNPVKPLIPQSQEPAQNLTDQNNLRF